MSGIYPQTPAPSSITIGSFTPTLVSISHSLKRQSRSRGAQRWSFKIRYDILTRDQYAEIFAFLIKQRGQFETFQFKPPILKDPRGVIGGTPLVNGASQTGRQIITDGWPVSTSNLLRNMDFIRFTNHGKSYLVGSDASSDVGGNSTIDIEPALMESPLDDEVIIVNDLDFTVGLSTDLTELPIAAPSVANFQVEFIEVA